MLEARARSPRAGGCLGGRAEVLVAGAEEVFDRGGEDARQAKGQGKAGVVSALLQRVDRLAADAEQVGEVGLAPAADAGSFSGCPSARSERAVPAPGRHAGAEDRPAEGPGHADSRGTEAMAAIIETPKPAPCIRASRCGRTRPPAGCPVEGDGDADHREDRQQHRAAPRCRFVDGDLHDRQQDPEDHDGGDELGGSCCVDACPRRSAGDPDAGEGVVVSLESPMTER